MTERQASSTDALRGWYETLRRRLPTLVLRPTARPLVWGIVVAAALVAIETVVVLYLERVAPETAFGAIFLVGVLVVSAGWNVGLAIATSIASTIVYSYLHLDGVAAGLFVFLPLALLANLLGGQSRLRAAESEQRRREADSSTARHAALGRVATLVARGADPVDVYPATVTELARGLGVEHTTLVHFEPGPWCTVLAAEHLSGTQLQVGERLSLDGDSLTGRIRRAGGPARIDDYADVEGTIASRLRGLGLHAGVGVPVVVDGEPRGALLVGSARPGPMPSDMESRVGDFAELVATAIANAETREELKASRARVVAAADQARRTIERDLHDGAQQRIVALGLGLRTVEASVSPDDQAVRLQLDNVINGLADLYTDIQELSRGIYPAILSERGLGPAIRALARRSPVPVSVEVDVDRRLPESTEVAAYYVVAEALTNAAKHSHAFEVTIRVCLEPEELLIEIATADDGVTLNDGTSGLISLRDRVDAVAGRLEIASPADGGTALTARIPRVGAESPS